MRPASRSPTRCSACNTRARVDKFKLVGERGGKLGGMSEAVRVQNTERQLAASQKLYKCKMCERNLVRSKFWPDDIRHVAQGIACKECCPKSPEERRQALRTCTACGRELPREKFWHADLYNGKGNFQCKECQPLAPKDRNKSGGDLECKTCKRYLARTSFWPADLLNAWRGLACKECCTTPPRERRLFWTCETCTRKLPRDRFWPGELIGDGGELGAKLGVFVGRPEGPAVGAGVGHTFFRFFCNSALFQMKFSQVFDTFFIGLCCLVGLPFAIAAYGG